MYITGWDEWSVFQKDQDAELEAWMKETEGLTEEEFVARYVR
jgi:hypothetical protein